MNGPTGLAFDAAGRLYVSDLIDNRILVFDNPYSGDTIADKVFGQTDFTGNSVGTSAGELSGPQGLAFDTAGRLHVADGNNHRILVYNDAATGDTIADRVIGQPNFTASASATTATGLDNPFGVAIDAAGRLFVAELANCRVIVFDNPGAGDTTADTVVGQPNFTSNFSSATATGLVQPVKLAFDGVGRLFVADGGGNRILAFIPDMLSKDKALPVASIVTTSNGNATFSAPKGTSETFVQVNLAGGDSTAGGASGLLSTAKAAATFGIYSTADYTCTFAGVSATDTIVMPIWTNLASMRLFVGLRSDTASLVGASLPRGIPNNDAGRRAFASTVILTEFSTSAFSSGGLLGDSKTTRNIGDSIAYTIRYLLSETTAAYFHLSGFDTKPGSKSFRFWFADTYGAVWVEDTTVTVTVLAGAAPASLEIVVSGITKDLPGGV